jgi:hypothetical protein
MGGINKKTCHHAANDRDGNRNAYYAQSSACHINIEYHPKDQPEVQMVMEGIRWLDAERQRKTSSADERETAKQACAALKKPQSVAGPRSATENGRRSKAQGPRQEVTPGRDVSDENPTVGTSLVIVQDRHEDTEPHTDDAGAEATSEVRFCYICSRILNGDEKYQHHMQLRHRSKKRLRWG